MFIVAELILKWF